MRAWAWVAAGLILLASVSAEADRKSRRRRHRRDRDKAPETEKQATPDEARPEDQPPAPEAPPAPPVDEAPKPWAAGVTPEQQGQAIALFNEGNAFFEESQYALALERYRKALAAWDHPSVRYNAAVCLMNLDQPVEAYENLMQALRYEAAPFTPEIYSQAQTYRKLLFGQLAEVKVTCKEAGAAVSLDGKALFKAPGEAVRLVQPGEHQLVASKTGFLTVTRTLVLLPGKQTVENVKLMTLAAATKYERRWPTWKPWAVVGGGVALAALGAPLYFLARSDAEQYGQRFNDACPLGCVDSEVPGDVASLETRSNIEQISAFSAFAVGGAVAVTGIVLVVMNQPRAVTPRNEAPLPAPAGPTVVPGVGPGGASVSLTIPF